MSGTKMVAAAGALMALLASAGVSRAETAPAQCSLGTDFKITSVSPLRRPTETGGYGGTVHPWLRGAEIHVAAKPGLTAEWLEHTLEAEIAAGGCAVGTGTAHVEVFPGESTFIVRITATDEGPGVTRLPERRPDERAASQILRWAQTLPMS